MAVVETVISTIGGLAATALTVYGTYWVTTRKRSQGRTKEEVVGHSFFSTLHSWNIEKVQTLSVNNKVKDEIMHVYAHTVLDIYITGFTNFISTLSKETNTPVTKLYLGRVQDTHDALYRTGIPEVFIHRIYEYTAALRENTFTEIEKIEQSSAPYFNKVYDTLSEVLFFVQTALKMLPQITSRLNGEFEETIKIWKKNEKKT